MSQCVVVVLATDVQVPVTDVWYLWVQSQSAALIPWYQHLVFLPLCFYGVLLCSNVCLWVKICFSCHFFASLCSACFVLLIFVYFLFVLFILYYFLDGCLFSEQRKKSLKWRVVDGSVWRRGTIIQIYCMKKYFP